MADFKLAIDLILDNEKGYSNNSSDLGGETNWGISKRDYPQLNIKDLTREQALDIYQRDYWNKYRIGEIGKQDIANYIFDMIVNMDYTKVVTYIQIALNSLSYPILKVDGVLGSETISAINRSTSPDWFIDKLRLLRIKHYIGRVATNKTQLVNLEGWIRRALK